MNNNPYQAPKSNLKTEESVASSKGTNPRFKFQIGENEIVGELYLMIGLERIYVNREVLFSKLNWRLKGVHPLHFDGEDYQLVFTTDNFITPCRNCTLEKRGVPLKRYRSESKPKMMYYGLTLLVIFAEMALSSILAAEFFLPEWWSYFSIFLTMIIMIVGISYGHKKGSVEITEVPLEEATEEVVEEMKE